MSRTVTGVSALGGATSADEVAALAPAAAESGRGGAFLLFVHAPSETRMITMQAEAAVMAQYGNR
jgi:hypothetical protein